MGYSELSQLLDREIKLLETLLFKLEEEHLLVASGRHHYLATANAEIQAIVDDLKTLELRRALSSADVCSDLGMDNLSSLQEISHAAEEPWRSVLVEARSRLLLVSARIAKAQNDLTGLLSQRVALVEDILTLVDASGVRNMYGKNGRLAKDASLSLLDGLL